MKYELYLKVAQEAARLVEERDYDSATAIFTSLLDTDISDLDKAMMCLNLGVIQDKLGCVEQALVWYDRGIDYECRIGRFTVAEHKAAYLAARGEVETAGNLYEQLLTRPDLTDTDKARIRHNVAVSAGG
jgi:tetratricopeptide (TPR) repeat protein